MNFTERHGFIEKKPLQATSIDNDLRHSLWNVLDISFSKIDSLSGLVIVLAYLYSPFLCCLILIQRTRNL